MLHRMHLKDLDIVFGWGRPEVVKEVATLQRGVPLPVAKPQLGGANRCAFALQRPSAFYQLSVFLAL